MARLAPFSRDVDAIISDLLSPAAQGRAAAAVARQILAETEQINQRALGSVPPHKTFVDGRPEAPLESVRISGGTIVFTFELVGDVLVFIGDLLRQHSPVKTGRYQGAHTLFADGVEVDPEGVIPPAAEYVFLNLIVYARRLDLDVEKAEGTGIYEAVAALAKGKFGNIADISFSFRAPLAGSIIQVPRTGPLTSSSRKGRRSKRAHPAGSNADLRRPSIIVRPR